MVAKKALALRAFEWKPGLSHVSYHLVRNIRLIIAMATYVKGKGVESPCIDCIERPCFELSKQVNKDNCMATLTA